MLRTRTSESDKERGESMARSGGGGGMLLVVLLLALGVGHLE